MSKKIEFNLEDIKHLYTQTTISQKEIADKYNTSIVTLNKFLKINNIERPKEIKNKIREDTSLKKFGVKNVSLLKEINDKKRNSNSKRLSKEIWIERFKEVHDDKYDYSLFSEYKNKNTKIQIICSTHGIFLQTPEAHYNLKQGCPKCAGRIVENTDFSNKAIALHNNKYDYSLVEYKSKNEKIKIICPIHGEFLQTPDSHMQGKGCPSCGHINSKPEKEIVEWLKSLNIEIIENSKNIISPLELDIFLPKYNLAIEYNGLYWHSFSKKGKYYHRDKWLMCKEKNIDLIQIWSSEWEEKQEICKSIILNRIGIVNRIMGRKCEIKEINFQDAMSFFNKNHLQGFTNSDYYIGLYYNNELTAGIEVNRSRFNSKYDWEIVRHVNKVGYSITGGFSKLIKYFKENYNGSIIDYCDQRWFNGNGHKNAGFIEIGITQPDLHYTDYHSIFTRNKFFGRKWKKTNENLNKYENLLEQGYDRIYGVGKKKYILQ